MNIVVLDPYFCDSHANWALGYAKHSRHKVDILHLGGSFWKWRMHGGAVALARQFLYGNYRPDLLLATDMLDLGNFLALTRRKTAGIPSAVYFHENQLSYPWSPGDADRSEKRDLHYGFINYLSALAADAVFFNSAYHENSFLKELAALLRRFPDHNGSENVPIIEAKSEVLPLGLDLKRFDEHEPVHDEYRDKSAATPPRILWNHRWEYDKNPDEFFKAMLELHEKGLPFELVVLGRGFRRKPAVFEKAQKKLKGRILRFGFEGEFSEYARWLWSCDILPVASIQDFFGISVMEAVHCGCFPLLPKRLAYPELFSPALFPDCFYDDFSDFANRLESMLSKRGTGPPPPGLRETAEAYDWRFTAPKYDDTMERIATRGDSGLRSGTKA